MRFKKLPLKEFMRIYRKVPRAGEDIIAVSRKGLLLTKRGISPFEGMWHIPGGSILHNEPVNHAIDRIIKEETGIDVEVLSHLGIIEYFTEGGLHTVSNTFLAQIISGKPRGSRQGKEVKFFKKIPQNLIPVQKTFIKKHWQEIKISYGTETI